MQARNCSLDHSRQLHIRIMKNLEGGTTPLPELPLPGTLAIWKRGLFLYCYHDLYRHKMSVCPFMQSEWSPSRPITASACMYKVCMTPVNCHAGMIYNISCTEAAFQLATCIHLQP